VWQVLLSVGDKTPQISLLWAVVLSQSTFHLVVVFFYVLFFFVIQGLASLVLKPMEESDLSPMDTSISAVAALLPSYHWLLVRLPSLPLFECVKMNICSDLRHVSTTGCIACSYKFRDLEIAAVRDLGSVLL